MRKLSLAALASLLAVSTTGVAPASSGESGSRLRTARLRGSNEVPAVSTTGNGLFGIRIDDEAETMSFGLQYADLEGDVAVAHVHFAQRNVNGGVMFFLCGGGGKPACPPPPATITGTVTAADITGPAGQGIVAPEFAEVAAAIRAGLAYANVHSSKHPGGEIRGQIR